MRAALGVGSAAALYALPTLALAVPSARRRFGIVDRGVSSTVAALTFDDGPHRAGTPAVLDVLERRGVKATFFVSGEQVRRWPELACEIVARGHELGMHGFRHRLLPVVGPRATVADLERGWEVVVDLTGVEPRFFRPPYGVFNLVSLAVARRNGWVPVLWTRWGRDWELHATAESIAGLVCRGLCGGDVVLLHDADHYSSPGSWRNTAGSLPLILDEVERRGLTAGLLSQVLEP